MKRLAAVLALTLLAAACGGSDTSGSDTTAATDSPDTASPDVPVDGSDVVLAISDEGGFRMMPMALSMPPRYVVYGDGRLVGQGPVPAIFPGPMLPNLQVTQLSSTTMAELLGLVERMGLEDLDRVIDDSQSNFVADASTTVVTYIDELGPHQYGVYALGLEDPSDDRQASLTEMIAVLDEEFAGGADTGQFQPDRVAIYLNPDTQGIDAEFAQERPWPLDAAPQPDAVVAGWDCTGFDGEEAATLLADLADATQTTLYVIDGTPHAATARPLFPHEDPCVGP